MDVGTVRVGVARCDPEGLLATPLETVPRDKDAINRIATIGRDLAVIEIVVGLPLTLAGKDSASTADARTFAADLAHYVAPLPVRLVDERLSTVSATRATRDSGVNAKRSRAFIDQAAAVEILQSALDIERSSGRVPGHIVKGSQP